MRQVHDLTLPIIPGGQNVNCYYAEQPKEETIVAGSFVGSVARGGSVNYRKLTLTPHGNGTHTECYGHISEHPQALLHTLFQPHIWQAVVVSLPFQRLANGDQVVGLDALKAVWQKLAVSRPEALIIRTLPNDDDKCQAQYSGQNPPYPEPGIGAWLAQQGVKHWLVDLPSVDREVDGGALQNHKGFWQAEAREGYKSVASPERASCTITELIYVPSHVPDGAYELMIAPLSLLSDAAPSRVLIWQS